MRYYRTIIDFFLILIILLSPLDYGGKITIRPLIIVSLISAFLLFLLSFKKIKESSFTFFSTPLNLPLLIFLFLCFVSIFYSIDRFVSCYGTLRFLNYGIFFFIILNTYSSSKDLKRILRIIILLATLFSLLGLFQYFTNTVPFPFCSKGRAFSIFITPNTFAAYLILVLPLLFALFIFKPRLMNQATTREFVVARFIERLFLRQATAVLLIIIIINWLALLATQSRGGWLSLSLSLLIIFPFLIKRRKDLPGFSHRFLILFFAVLISTSLFFLHSSIFMKKASEETALKRAQDIVNPFEVSSAQARLKFYKSAITVVRKYPFSGTGFHTFHLIYPSVKDPSFRKTTHFYVHNDYLQIFSELGVFGLISFLSLIFFYLYFSFSLLKKLPTHHPPHYPLPSRGAGATNKEHRLARLPRCEAWPGGKVEEGGFALILGTLGGSLSLFIHSFFEFNFYIMALMIILFFYFALSFVVAKESGILKKELKVKIKPSLRKPLSCLAVFCFLVIAFLVFCPLLSEIYTNRGNTSLRREEYKKAEKQLKRALFFCPLVSNYHTNLASVYNVLGKRKKAEAEYKKGVTLSPYRVKNCADFGQFYLESPFKEEREKSIFYLKRATFLDPNSESHNLRLGIAYKKLRRPKRAIESFLIYEKFHPGDLRVKISLAECWLSLGNKEMALFYLREVLRRNPKNVLAFTLLKRTGAEKPKGVLILCYHNIVSVPENKWCLSINSFREQMQFLKKNNFHPITMKKLSDWLNKKASLPEKPVLITFDDGWLGQYNYAYPILKKMKFPAIFFIVSGNVDKNIPVSPYGKIMNWNQIRELNEEGFEIGCHTVSHPDLTSLSKEEIRKELLNSKLRIEEEIGKKVIYFAYPYSTYNELIKRVLEETGYRIAVILRLGLCLQGDSPLEIRRTPILSYTNLEEFEKLCKTLE